MENDLTAAETILLKRAKAMRAGHTISDCKTTLKEYQKTVNRLLKILKDRSELVVRKKTSVAEKEAEVREIKKERDESIFTLNSITSELDSTPTPRHLSLASYSTIASCTTCDEITDQIQNEQIKAADFEAKLVECKFKYAENSAKLMDLEDENDYLRKRIESLHTAIREQEHLQSCPNSLENSPRLQTDYNIYRTPKSKSKAKQHRNKIEIRQLTFGD